MKNKLKYLILLSSIFISLYVFGITSYAIGGGKGSSVQPGGVVANATNIKAAGYDGSKPGYKYKITAQYSGGNQNWYYTTNNANLDINEFIDELGDASIYSNFDVLTKDTIKGKPTAWGQRQYGATVYYTEVAVPRGGDATSMAAAVEAAINTFSGAEAIGDVNYKKDNSYKDQWRLSNPIFTEAQFSVLLSASSSGNSADFFMYMTNAGIPSSYIGRASKAYAAFMAGTSDKIPVVFATPATATASGTVNSQSLGLPVVTTDHSGFVQAYQAASGSSLFGRSVGSGTTTLTGKFVEIQYMFPYDGPTPPRTQSTITAVSSPQMQTHDWLEQPTASGEYQVKINIKNQQEAANAEYIDIVLHANFAGSTYNQLSQSVVKVDVPDLFKYYLVSKSNTEVTYHLPTALIATWNSEWYANFTVNVTGGHNNAGEEKVGAYFYATLSPGGNAAYEAYPNFPYWTAYQQGGQTYISYRYKDVDTEDQPYDKHSTTTPVGTGILVANDAAKQDWDVAVGIPSTETTTAIVDGEIGMYDITGYLCARNKNGSSAVGNQSNQGTADDLSGSNLGITQSNQAVDREIKIISKITNCWGGGNKPDQLSPTHAGASGGVSQSDGSTDSTREHSCSTAPSCHVATISCPGRYVDRHHHASEWYCTLHGGTLGWHQYEEWHNGSACSSGCSNAQKQEGTNEDGSPNMVHDEPSCGCACSPCSDGSHPTNFHDCTWSWDVQNAVDGDSWLGKSGLADSGSAWARTKQGSVTLGGDTNAYGKLFNVHTGVDCGVEFQVNIEWRPSEDRQFYIVYYSVDTINNGLSVSTPDGCHSYGTGSAQTDWHGNIGRTCIAEDQIISEDYTHGTGTDCTTNENMIHQGTHTYTMTFHETIDAYAYRTITDAQIYSLTGIDIKNVHTITRDAYSDILGNDYPAGTFCAPLDETARGQGVSGTSAIGYLFRCCGPNNGEYASRNGRVEFEAWYNAHASFGGNTSVSLSHADYYLGDVEVNLITVQDHEYGESITAEDTYDVEATAGITTRGDDNQRWSDNGHSDNDWITTASDTKYKDLGAAGDCTGAPNNTDNEQNHSDMCVKELKAMYHYWCGENKSQSDTDFYKANVISDTFVYGGTQGMTTVICDDAHAVDGKTYGVLLFNVTISPESCPTKTGSTGEKTAYRNHKNIEGTDTKHLQELLLKDKYTGTAIADMAPMPLASEVGGNVPTNGTTAYCLLYDLAGCTASGGSAGAPVSFTKGDGVADGVYNGRISVSHDSQTPGSGTVEIEVSTSGSSGSSTSSNYWADHTYYGKGSGSSKTTLTSDIVLNKSGGSYTNNGDATRAAYNKLTISDLKLVDWTPNGMWNTAQAGANYIQNILVSSNVPQPKNGWTYRQAITSNHESIASGSVIAPCGSNNGYLSQIYIYDPVTSEYDCAIGEQEGKWADGVTDETMYDQRVGADGRYLDQTELSANEDKYVVQSRHLWSWISPIGQFGGIGGSGSPGAETAIDSNGLIYRNNGKFGYVDNMNIDTWVKGETIAYPFIAGVEKKTFSKSVGIEIPLTEHYSSGIPSGTKGAVKQTNVTTSLVTKFGNKVAVTDTCNITEVENAEVYYRTYAINCYIMESDSELSGNARGGYQNQMIRNDDKRCNAADNTDTVDLVGSIGNLSIHDTTDFRFSEYFKKQVDPSTWLIDGVIHVVDQETPVKIVSSYKDIMLQRAEDLAHKHNTLATTAYIQGRDLGMAGPFNVLPLVPMYNTNENYIKDCLRIGYKTYASIETIGNYQSKLNDSDTVPTGSANTSGDVMEGDTRRYFLEINSVYMLYDLDTGKFYDIDIWSGSTGSKERLYNGTSHKPEAISVSGELFQNVDEEYKRRNVSDDVHNKSYDMAYLTEDADGFTSPTATHSDVHYIGTPGKIRLDNRDLYYIGSAQNNTEDDVWDDYTDKSPYDIITEQAQQYHFTSGLTSTSIPTLPFGDDPSTQTGIVNASTELQKLHPHAVIVEFQEYIAHGTVYTLRLNGSVVNTDTFQIYRTGEIPEGYGERADDPVIYRNVQTFNPKTNTPTGYFIDKDLTPVVVMEAYKSAADDREVSGTH